MCLSVPAIRERCNTTAPDVVIDDYICLVNSRIGECVAANYPECEQNVIMSLAVCAMLQDSHGGGEVKSESAPNGASITYETKGSTQGNGFDSNDYWRMLRDIDTAGCTQSLITSGQYFVGTAGSASESCATDGYCGVC